jgi:hypothetical protein
MSITAERYIYICIPVSGIPVDVLLLRPTIIAVNNLYLALPRIYLQKLALFW